MVVRPLTRCPTGSRVDCSPALAVSRKTLRDVGVDSGPVCRQCRRKEDEDQENREEEHRGGPRQDGGQAAEVWIHGRLTRHPRCVLRRQE